MQKPPIVKEFDQIEFTCSTLNSCPSKLQIQESTQPPFLLGNPERGSNVHSLTATWQDDGKTYSCQTEENKDPYLIQNITLNVECKLMNGEFIYVMFAILVIFIVDINTEYVIQM